LLGFVSKDEGTGLASNTTEQNESAAKDNPIQSTSLSSSFGMDWKGTVQSGWSLVNLVASNVSEGAAKNMDMWFGDGEGHEGDMEKLPWEEVESIYGDTLSHSPYEAGHIADELKSRILSISVNVDNIVDPPPPPSFDYEHNRALRSAPKFLEADASLQVLRFKCVPKKMKEEVFWFAYFWRVSECIKQLQNDIIGRNLPHDLAGYSSSEDSNRKSPVMILNEVTTTKNKESSDDQKLLEEMDAIMREENCEAEDETKAEWCGVFPSSPPGSIVDDDEIIQVLKDQDFDHLK